MQLTYQKLHLELTALGATKVVVKYSGTDDSMSSFECLIYIPMGAVLADEKNKAAYDTYHKELKSAATVAFGKITSSEWVAESRARAAAVEKAGMLASSVEGGCFTVDPKHLGYSNDDMFSFFAGLFKRVDAAFDFNNDGSGGEFEWDLTTNETKLTAGWFETMRKDTEYTDLFEAEK